MTRPVSDALSLALPKARGRTRIKRPRKPTFEEIVALFWTVWSVVFGALDLVTGDLVNAAVMAYFAATWWRHYQRARAVDCARVRFVPIGGWAAGGAVIVASLAWSFGPW